MKWIKDQTSHYIIHSIVNGEGAYIDHKFRMAPYSSIVCGKFKNARLRIARKMFFLSEFGIAFRRGFDEDFKRKINKL